MLGEWGIGGTRVVASYKSWERLRELNRQMRRQNQIATVSVKWCDVFEDFGGPMVDHCGERLRYCEVHKQVFWPYQKQCKCKERFNTDARMHHVRTAYFKTIESCESLFFLISTRLPQNVAPFFTGANGDNVAIGISVTDTADAIEKSDAFQNANCLSEIAFVAAEPLLGPLDLKSANLLSYWQCRTCPWSSVDASGPGAESCEACGGELEFIFNSIDWVIVGGDMAGRYPPRPCDIEWIRNVVNDCKSTHTPVFVTQLGSHYANHSPDISDRKASLLSEWPIDLQIRQIPATMKGLSDE
jgi:protein gp37